MQKFEEKTSKISVEAAFALLERGLVKQAHEAFSKLVRTAETNDHAVGPAEAGLAFVHLKQGDLDQAMRHAIRSRDAGCAEGHAAMAEILGRRGERAAAAEAYLSAYIQCPVDWIRLAAYCELTGRPYLDPVQEGHEPPGSPLTRLWLYQDLQIELEHSECRHTFQRTAALSDIHKLDPILLFQFLNGHGIRCDCEASEAWMSKDAAGMLIWLAGWFEGDLSLPERLIRSGLMRETRPEEKPEKEIEESTDDPAGGGHIVRLRFSREDGAEALPPQLVDGYDLRSTFKAIQKCLQPGQRVVLAARFAYSEEPPAVVLITPEAVETSGVEDLACMAPPSKKRIDKLFKRLCRYTPPSRGRDTPTQDEQDWLRNKLADLIQHGGAESFVRPPLQMKAVLADWRPDAQGMSVLIQRIMKHAGLGNLKVVLKIDAVDQNHRVLGWFSGIEGDTAHFGCCIKLHDKPETVAATLCHEVAHAWREYNGLRYEDRQQDEILTDLTAVYLGFGIAVANASFRFRTKGSVINATAYYQWGFSRAGYLPAQAFGYLLAVQSRCRKEGMSARRQLAGQLELTQRQYLRAALKVLPERDKLCMELGIPRWLEHTEKSRFIGSTTAESPLSAIQTSIECDNEQKPIKFNKGKPVFRIPKKMLKDKTILMILGGFALFPITMIATRNPFLSLNVSLGAVVAAFLFGPRVRDEICSDASCETIVPQGVEICPGCGGTVSGTLKHRSQRFEAEEALLAEKLRDDG